MKKISLKVVNNSGEILNTENIGEMMDQYEYKKNKIGAFYGELGHQDTFDISLSKISHNVEKLYIEDGELYCDINILNTAIGNDFKKRIIEEGVEFDIEPRYSGIRNEDGYINNLQLYSFDIVNIKKNK